jgi:NAD(P)-dependent dehydrogenase (short-subunit alcohol dehydrogenase family)
MTDQSKTALITGASRGFGAAAAEELALQGYHIIAVARTTGALEELDDRIQAKGGSATLVPMSITDELSIQRLCLAVYERWGGLDLWVHAAIHAPPLSPAPHVDAKDWDKTCDINITATARLIPNIEPLLRARKGIAAHIHDPQIGRKFFAAYGASKAAQKALFDSWAAEATTGSAHVVSFTPNPMPTATRARFFPGEDRSLLADPRDEARRFVKELL